MEYIAVYTTLPDEESAKEIARKMVEERLVACVNFFPIKSVYHWKGGIEEDEEYVLLMKTRKELYPEIEKRLRDLHPYEVPAIVSYKIERGLREYLTWIEDTTEVNNE